MGIGELDLVDRTLERYLAKEIAIPTTARSSASTSQNHLRQVLRNKANADSSFPELLTQTDADFLGGSFARHTKIWPLDDIDLFLPLEGGGLMYNRDGFRLPFTIATDDKFSRLTQSNWQTDAYVDSVKVLNGFRDGLRDSYPSSTVSLDRHCVNLQTTIASTSESEGIGFDVTPCFRLDPDDGSEFFYLVPDGTGGWIRSNPRKDTNLCIELQSFHGTYRQAVRLVKYWNKTQVNNAFTSYYIELAMSKKFLALKQQTWHCSCLLRAFAIGMAELKAAYTSGNQTPLVPEAPAVEAPMLTDSQRTTLNYDSMRATKALQDAGQNALTGDAFEALNTIFTTGFFR
jgi:hypothetical protein